MAPVESLTLATPLTLMLISMNNPAAPAAGGVVAARAGRGRRKLRTHGW